MSGEAGADDVALARSAFKEGQERVETLQGVLRLAEEAAAKRLAEARREKQRNDIAALKQFLAGRTKHVESFVEHMSEAVQAYEWILRANERALQVAPHQSISIVDQIPTLLGYGPMRAKIENEIFRMSHRLIARDVTSGARFAFPGGTPPSLLFSNQPEKIKPLVDSVKEATEYALAIVAAKPAPPLPDEPTGPVVLINPSAGEEITVDPRKPGHIDPPAPAREETGLPSAFSANNDPNGIAGNEHLLDGVMAGGGEQQPVDMVWPSGEKVPDPNRGSGLASAPKKVSLGTFDTRKS